MKALAGVTSARENEVRAKPEYKSTATQSRAQTQKGRRGTSVPAALLVSQKSSSQFLASSIETGVVDDGSLIEPVTTGSSSIA